CDRTGSPKGQRTGESEAPRNNSISVFVKDKKSSVRALCSLRNSEYLLVSCWRSANKDFEHRIGCSCSARVRRGKEELVIYTLIVFDVPVTISTEVKVRVISHSPYTSNRFSIRVKDESFNG